MATIELECHIEGCTYKAGEVSKGRGLLTPVGPHDKAYAYRGTTTAASCTSNACTTWSKTRPPEGRSWCHTGTVERLPTPVECICGWIRH